MAAAGKSDLPPLPPAPAGAIIGSRNITVTLKGSGTVSRYGRGTRARTAPSGETLWAFELQFETGDVGALTDGDIAPSFGLAIDGGPPRRLPVSDEAIVAPVPSDHFFVAGLPADVRTADLVVTDAGIAQRLSILTGAPAAGNIAVLRRPNRYGKASAAPTAVATVRTRGRTVPARPRMTVEVPSLGYFSLYGPQHVSGPDRAWLNVPVCYRWSDPLEFPSCFGAANLTLTSAGGAPIRAHDVGHAGYFVFDVPATFRTGTVTVTGPTTSLDGAVVTLTRPYRVTVSIPP
jgi:hypothetical protein